MPRPTVQNRHDVIAMKRVAQRFWAPCSYQGSSLIQFASTSHYGPLSGADRNSFKGKSIRARPDPAILL
jgi:hypothetical protein